MEKKQELIDYLNTYLLLPIINSPNASQELKYSFTDTSHMLNQLSAKGILSYIWTQFLSDSTNNILINRLLDEGFTCTIYAINTFKMFFTYEWLIS